MYIKNGKIGIFKTVNAIIIGVAGFLALCNLIFAVIMLTLDEFRGEMVAIVLGVIFLVLMSAMTAIVIWRAIAIHRVTRCRIYNSIFEEDHDGVIKFSSISAMTGFSEAAVIRDLMWLTKAQYIHNVTLTRTAVVINVLPGENTFVTVACPTCGAHITIRTNGGGRCEHCGTFMRLRENQNV